MSFGAIVQENGGSGSGPTSFDATLPGAITAGNLVAIKVTANNVPGGANTGWNKSTGMSPVANAQGLLWWFIAAGGDTIPTVTFASAAEYAWKVVEYEGPFDASPYEISAGSAANGQLTDVNAVVTTPDITPTAGGNYLLLGGLGASGGGPAWDVPAVTFGSFTNSFGNDQQQFRQDTADAHLACLVSRVVTSAAGSYSTSGTVSVENISGGSCRTRMTIAFKRGAITNKPLKVWNGTSWVEKPVKVWNGTSWVTKIAKIWDGSAWV